MDPSRNTLASTVYFAIVSSVLHAWVKTKKIYFLIFTIVNFHDNSKNKNRKIDFSFDSANCTSIMKVGSKLREGGRGVSISLVGTEPYTSYLPRNTYIVGS